MTAEFDPRHRVCAVCARVMEYVTPDDGEPYWRHGLGTVADGLDDHLPVPVTPGEIRTEWKCDFCYLPEVTYGVPVADFSLAGFDRAGSIGDWSACTACADLITRNDWNGVIRRVAESWEERCGEPLAPSTEAKLRAVYRQLRKNMIGLPRPFKWRRLMDEH